MGGILALFPAVLMILGGMSSVSHADKCTPVPHAERFMTVNNFEPYLSGDDRDGRRTTVWVNREVPAAIITYYNEKTDKLCNLSIMYQNVSFY
jgi:hypothetical protein